MILMREGIIGSCFLLNLVTIIGGEETKSGALFYLTKYGYIQPKNGSSSLLTEEGLEIYLKKAILDFQAFAGLNQTGELDAETQDLMITPRCGVKDTIGHGAHARRRRRYVLQGGKWRVTELTYRVSKYPSTDRLSKFEVDQEIKKAFSMWQSVSSLKFEERNSGSVHIDIRFEKYEHGDGDPFDGAGGTLAHAYFPQFGGDVHVDDSEYWTIDSFKGTNLLQTMVHELGHSLGLSHSDVKSSIMAPFYKGWEPNLKLTSDDISAIRALYGDTQEKPATAPETPGLPQTTSPPPSGGTGTSAGGTGTSGGGSNSPLCGDSTIDTIVTTEDGSTYVFKGEDFWKLTEDSVAPGYPRRIGEDWAGLPGSLDAALTWRDSGSTYFFKGDQYWKFDNMKPRPDYPRLISKGFPDIPSNLDAALVWGGTGKIYFFKGNDYWKFDPDRTSHVQVGKYPRDISLWGLPANIDAALQYANGKSYFYKAGQYWRFNDRKFTLDIGDPPFPRNSGEWWFGCPKVRPLHSDSEVVVATAEGGTVHVILESNDFFDHTAGNEDLDSYDSEFDEFGFV